MVVSAALSSKLIFLNNEKNFMEKELSWYFVHALLILCLYFVFTFFMLSLYFLYTFVILSLYFLYTFFILCLYFVYTLFILSLQFVYTFFIFSLYFLYTLFILSLYFLYTLFEVSSASSRTLTFRKKIFICFNDSLSKMIKNAFCLILKVIFVLKILKFLSSLFVHVEKTA